MFERPRPWLQAHPVAAPGTVLVFGNGDPRKTCESRLTDFHWLPVALVDRVSETTVFYLQAKKIRFIRHMLCSPFSLPGVSLSGHSRIIAPTSSPSHSRKRTYSGRSFALHDQVVIAIVKFEGVLHWSNQHALLDLTMHEVMPAKQRSFTGFGLRYEKPIVVASRCSFSTGLSEPSPC